MAQIVLFYSKELEAKINPEAGAIKFTLSNAPLKIWNHQLIRYAGFETSKGIIGDPASIELTHKMKLLGWNPKPAPWTILPIVIQKGDKAPQIFEIPKYMIKEVPMEHPDHPWFADLGLQWYAVPMIADMELHIGGIKYRFAPFNGWYMGIGKPEIKQN